MQGNQKQTDWAYIAGVMDSDGCFMIIKQNRVFNGKNCPQHTPTVKISQVEPECIKYITHDLGMGKYKLDRTRIREYENGRRFGSKPMYDWYIRSREKLKPFLTGIIPYLRIKKNRAEILLEFCNSIKLMHRGWYGPNSNSELARREDLYIKIRKLNSGKVAATTKS